MRRIYYLAGLLCLAGMAAVSPVWPQDSPDGKTPAFDIEKYQFGLLRRGPQWTAEKTPETERIQAGHMAHIRKMAESGGLIAAGPIGSNGDLRGILIFRAESPEAARALAAEDPAVKAGRLAVAVFTWRGTKGIGEKYAAEAKKNPGAPVTMVRYHLGLLRRGPQWTGETTPETQRLQQAHLGHIRRMLDEKKFVAAGPLEGGGDLRGVVVIAAETEAEARPLAEADPAVKAGRMAVDLHPWSVARGVFP